MPNIKPELRRGFRGYIHTRRGEALLVLSAGGFAWVLISATSGAIAVFVSETLHPFTYPFIHKPLHGYLPSVATQPRFFGNLIFGALFAFAVYTFEKNIFYRRFNLALKAFFASVVACAFVFISGLISYLFEFWGFGTLSLFLLEADVSELPALAIYYYLAALFLFPLCDNIRRRIFLLP